ncbi:MAG TPA: CoA transferase [Candidatus Mcinerneyibacteriales bacterium]|nr:CoA transferase [Candidatus Mcinerneyibacteriales bacterium]HPQ90166.1 CoA transferase [Candidatus Mcinerneyibacteriales bacterium]
MHDRSLEGLKVLDLSRVLAGPFAGQVLGDLGAEVIKVEFPHGGDTTRGWGPPFAGGEAAYYLCANRNKRSITLDFTKGREVLERLVKWADIVLLNLRIDSLKKQKLTYEDLKAINPKIIYGLITGFGTSGPYAEKSGFDVVAQGMGGIMSITGEPEGEPMKVGVAIVDVTSALYLVIGILSALRQREKTGEGQMVDVALLDSQVSWLVNVASSYLVSGNRPKRYGNQHATIVPYQVFKVKDGYLIVGVGSEKQWKDFCRMLHKEEWAEDPRFHINKDRVKNREILIPLIQEEMMLKTREEWLDLMEEFAVPGGPINEVDEVFADPQVLHREMLVKMPHPTAGEVKLVGSPIKMSETPVSYEMAPPLLGQHTEEILKELGYSASEIQALQEDQIV